MVSRLELKNRWKQILNEPLNTEEDECVGVLCENEWVRILLLRNTDNPNVRSIEIEVSVPPESIFLSAADVVGSDVRPFLLTLISHMEYLLRLDEAGLTLEALTRDGIYTAHLELKNDPSDTIFEVLIPPEL